MKKTNENKFEKKQQKTHWTPVNDDPNKKKLLVTKHHPKQQPQQQQPFMIFDFFFFENKNLKSSHQTHYG